MATTKTLVREGITMRYNEVVAALSDSDAVMVDSHKDIVVTVIPAAGGATIFTTTDPETMITADTARWIEWSEGAVIVDTAMILDESVAIKLTNNDAGSTAELVIATRKTP